MLRLILVILVFGENFVQEHALAISAVMLNNTEVYSVFVMKKYANYLVYISYYSISITVSVAFIHTYLLTYIHIMVHFSAKIHLYNN